MDEVKENEMGKAYSTHGDKINAYRIVVGKSEENKLLGGPRHFGRLI
jgi:hypothetical protein